MSQRTNADPIASYHIARRRMLLAFGLLVVVLSIGSAGYFYLGAFNGTGWVLGDCIYMTAITITTVGFEEVLDVKSVPGGREWTLTLLVFGISANLYVVSAITSFFVESDFSNIRRYRRLRRKMEHISDHYIVCGVGRTGTQVAEELLAVGEGLVAIDERPELLEPLRERGILTLVADATEDEVLAQAGIERAKGIVATLDDDKTNMFIVVTARQTNPTLRIVAKGVGTSAPTKLRRAGADAVVSPAHIGGMRLASELLRPTVVRYLDDMLRDKSARLRIEEAVVAPKSELVGQTLREANLRERYGVLVLATKTGDGTLTHVPASNLRLTAGLTLIAIGTPEQISALRFAVGHR